jgi:Tol biopolymer transport system component
MNRVGLVTLAAGLAGVLAGAAHSQAIVSNGKISFWSDRAFGGRAQVFVMDADGGNQRRLTELFSAKRGDFSPDGTKLVFDGRGRETLFDFDIFVMNADGSGVTQLTHGPDRDTQAVWSPDAGRVSFVRTKTERGLPSVWLVSANGSNAHRFAAGGSAAWSPGGKRLAIGSLGGLTIVTVDGKRKKRIVSGETEVAAWSRDGRRILFTSWRDGNTEVYVVRTNGNGLRRLTRSRGDDFAADFSPDGRRILFSSDRRGGYLQVYVMNLNGSGVRNLSRSQSADWATSWQPVP